MIFIRTENVFTKTCPMQNYPNDIKYRCNQQRKATTIASGTRCNTALSYILNRIAKMLNIKPIVNDPVSPIKIFLPRFGFPKTL